MELKKKLVQTFIICFIIYLIIFTILFKDQFSVGILSYLIISLPLVIRFGKSKMKFSRWIRYFIFIIICNMIFFTSLPFKTNSYMTSICWFISIAILIYSILVDIAAWLILMQIINLILLFLFKSTNHFYLLYSASILASSTNIDDDISLKQWFIKTKKLLSKS